MTYETVKKEALALPAIQQDGLLKELAAQHVKRKAEELAAKSSGWVQWVWRALALGVGAAVTFCFTSCSTAQKTTETAQDGTVTVTERSFTLSGTEAATLARYFIPVVTTK